MITREELERIVSLTEGRPDAEDVASAHFIASSALDGWLSSAGTPQDPLRSVEQAAGSASVGTEREEFEADAKQMDFDLTRRNLAVSEPWAEYADEATGHRWAGWMAGAEWARRTAPCVSPPAGDVTDFQILEAFAKAEPNLLLKSGRAILALAAAPAAPASEDVRELSKWLNEENTAPINRVALARVLAAAAPVAEPAWQPIETAPKEEELLGWRDDCGPLLIMHTSFDRFATDRECEEMDEDSMFQKDWFGATIPGGFERLEGSETPTHWMPLPPEPHPPTPGMAPGEKS